MSGEALDEHRLRRLIEVGRSLVSELDLEVVLREVIEVARRLTGARYAALGILDETRSELERFLYLGIDEETRTAIGELPRGRGVLGLLIEDPVPLRLDDVEHHPRSHGFPAAHPPMKTFLGVPIVVRGEAYGNLYLTEKEGGKRFDEADEQAATVLAEWAAIAIDNARSVADDRLRHSIASAERERARWARELHDDTLQGLGARRVLLSTALSKGDTEALEVAAREVVAQLGEEIDKLRALISELRPAVLDEIGLAAAIDDLVKRAVVTEGLEIEHDVSLAHEAGEAAERLHPELESALYRVVQEALTNVAKHARAERVWICVSEAEGCIEIEVRDDGVGFNPGAQADGFGLVGMRERVSMVGGTLEVSSSPGAGTLLRATIPAVRAGLAASDAA